MIAFSRSISNLTFCFLIALLIAATAVPDLARQTKSGAGSSQTKKTAEESAGQADKNQTDKNQPDKAQPQTDKNAPAKGKVEAAAAVKYTVAEAIAEYAIIAYGGRTALNQARVNTQEEGTIRLATDQGDATGSYKLRASRKEKSWQDLVRTDLEITPPEPPGRAGTAHPIKYVIAFNGGSVWSAQNGQYTTPRPEVDAAFRAQLTHDYTTLLHYKEDGSKVDLIGPDTVAGIETKLLELTTPNGDKTKYWISTKTFRILHTEYELKLFPDQKPVKFRVSFYYSPPRIVQNTLLPSKRVMNQDGKFAQEIMINSAIYSAKHDPEIYQHLQQDQ